MGNYLPDKEETVDNINFLPEFNFLQQNIKTEQNKVKSIWNFIKKNSKIIYLHVELTNLISNNLHHHFPE